MNDREPNTTIIQLQDIQSNENYRLWLHSDIRQVCAIELGTGEWLDVTYEKAEELILTLCKLYKKSCLSDALKAKIDEIFIEVTR